MAFSPDLPFPKTPGNPIMAKDWNDAIGEVQRLDTAKLGRVAAETMAGPLTINNALGVGTATAAQAGTRLHVVDSLNPTVARMELDYHPTEIPEPKGSGRRKNKQGATPRLREPGGVQGPE